MENAVAMLKAVPTRTFVTQPLIDFSKLPRKRDKEVDGHLCIRWRMGKYVVLPVYSVTF